MYTFPWEWSPIFLLNSLRENLICLFAVFDFKTGLLQENSNFTMNLLFPLSRGRWLHHLVQLGNMQCDLWRWSSETVKKVCKSPSIWRWKNMHGTKPGTSGGNKTMQRTGLSYVKFFTFHFNVLSYLDRDFLYFETTEFQPTPSTPPRLK